MEVLNYIHYGLSCFLIIAVVLPFIQSSNWVFRIFEYPRYQKFVLCIIAIVIWLFIIDYESIFQLILIGALVVCSIFLAVKIYPYTPLFTKEMLTVQPDKKEDEITIFTANVYQDNNQFQAFLNQILSFDPDIIFLLETNLSWANHLQPLKEKYAYSLQQPQDNTYGMLFFSKLKIIKGAIQFLIKNSVPSVEAIVEMKNGQHIKIWGLHPMPPVPKESKNTKAKDRELMQVAFKAKTEKLPVIVMGDLNDVAWSYVTELFRKTSGLLDPRRGRGFFSTFSAKNWWMRFPLDYIFCSNHFGLINMRRCANCGSDHFPMFSHFKYEPALIPQQDKPQPDEEEQEDAEDKAEGK